MPTVTIILSDDNTEEDGVNFKVEFDPPLQDHDIITAAQSEAAFLIEVMQRRAAGQKLNQMAEEMEDDDFGIIVTDNEPEESPN